MNFIRRLGKVSTGINIISANVSILLFTLMTDIVWAQIFYRFVLGDGIVWAEEIAKYMMVWMALLGASVVYYEQGHIAIESFVAGRRCLKWIKIAHCLFAGALFVVLLIYGIKYAQFGQKFISPASGIRKFWPYLAIPSGAAFLLFQCICQFLSLLFENKQEDASGESGSHPITLDDTQI